MTASRHFKPLAFAALVVACLAARAGVACNIPVFRYALEQWQPDAYEFLVLHRGPLDPGQQALLERLEATASASRHPANASVRTADLTRQDQTEAQELWEAAGSPQRLPWIVVRYPVSTRISEPAFSAPLDATVVDAMIDSPARREIVRRIVAGESAVWLLIESGDREKDDAAAATLREQLERSAQKLKLPPQQPDADGDPLPGDGAPEPTIQSPLPLRLHFSLLRIARDDPAERALVSLLLGSERDLREFREPIAIPVFGRGRSYYALVGRGINADNIEANCAFLVGACSCQIKSQNPGVDLLLAADWDALVTGEGALPRKLPEPTGLGALVAYEEVARREPTETPIVSDVPAVVPDTPDAGASTALELPIYVSVIAAIALGVVIVAIGTLLIKSRSQSLN